MGKFFVWRTSFESLSSTPSEMALSCDLDAETNSRPIEPEIAAVVCAVCLSLVAFQKL